MKQKQTSSFRLDEQVYLTMIIVAIVSLMILGFRFTTRHPCPPVTLQIESSTDSFQKGNLISFKADAIGGNEFTWNFGDGSKDDQTSPSVFHKFSNAGTFTVSVTVDGECSEFQNVVITESRLIDNDILGTTFTGPDTAYMGLPVTFEDLSSKSSSWEWHFEDPMKVDGKSKSATYVYKTAGVKKISLMINGRRDLVQSRFVYIIDRDAERSLAKAKEPHTSKQGPPKVVFVNNSPTTQPLANPTQTTPTEPAPKKEEDKPKPKAPDLTHVQMESFLMEVVQGTKHAEDFSGYLCGNLQKIVVYNSNNISFSTMCSTLKGLKAKKIKTIKVTLFPNAATNCQESMVVTVEMKKGFLGL